jgi:hypothetical protein
MLAYVQGVLEIYFLFLAAKTLIQGFRCNKQISKIANFKRDYISQFICTGILLQIFGISCSFKLFAATLNKKIFLKKSCLTMEYASFFSQAKSNRLRWESNPRILDSNLGALPLRQLHDKNHDF